MAYKTPKKKKKIQNKQLKELQTFYKYKSIKIQTLSTIIFNIKHVIYSSTIYRYYEREGYLDIQ